MEISVKWPRVATWLREQVQRWKRRDIIPATDLSMRESIQLKAIVEKAACPGCTQKGTLLLNKAVRAPDGWEVDISCKNCDFQAVINSRGHEIIGISRRPDK